MRSGPMTSAPGSYIARPVAIQAMRYTDATKHAVWNWLDELGVMWWTNRAGDLHVMTFQDGRPAEIGDWIVRGTEGEVYPVKDIVFTRKYRDRDALA